MHIEDRITPDEVQNLSQLFMERVARSPDKVAYQYYDEEHQQWFELTWRSMAQKITQWQHGLRNEKLVPGDRIAIMMKNSPDWVVCEQAALGLGLVVVPLYTNDRAENACYIINNANIKIAFIDNHAQLNTLQSRLKEMHELQRIVTLHEMFSTDSNLIQPLTLWLQNHDPDLPNEPARLELDRHSLASIVYTSGTTGKPKGVMLSHGNILWNAYSSSQCYAFRSTDLYLSFLPLSHMLERTVGYYLPIVTGATVAFARSIESLADDLASRKPTVIVTVPRIFERVSNKLTAQLKTKGIIANTLFRLCLQIGWTRFLYFQKKSNWKLTLLFWPLLNILIARKIIRRLGGRLRVAICGGAPLGFEIGKLFTSLGLTISQGYGLTETSPVVCTNRVDNNEISSVGEALPDVEIKLGDGCELLVRSPGVMLGYWRDDKATRNIIDADGWLHTGDQARIQNNHIYITGRLKEIIVLSNGEKISPCDIEMAICDDPLFDQVMVLGEGKPFLSALIVLNKKQYDLMCQDMKLSEKDDPNSHTVNEHLLQHVKSRLIEFPGYAKIYRIHATFTPWTVDNSLMTPTLKLKRHAILEKFCDVINDFYQGH